MSKGITADVGLTIGLDLGDKALQLPRPCSGLTTCGTVWHWNLGASFAAGQRAVQLSAQQLGGTAKDCDGFDSN
jgi:hypothetical protein